MISGNRNGSTGLKGKTALVTGASSGIGFATAHLLAAAGANVAITYLNNNSGAEKCIQSMSRQNVETLAIRADLSDPKQVRTVVGQVRDGLGPIDILINNAGSLVKRRRLLEISEQDWDVVMNLNLKSVFLCCQAVAAGMMERRSGVIVNVSSIAGRNGGALGSTHYAAAKGAVITLTKGIAKELAPFNIRVNAVSPGVIDTPFHEMFSTPEAMENYVKMIPLSRIGTSEEVARAIFFLASEASSYIAGETLEINGGMLML
ncbi:MAG TPA: 3-oxoacyl-ACP reductase family protein [Acidobacteriota bacterium]